jgi:hypothetical protein
MFGYSLFMGVVKDTGKFPNSNGAFCIDLGKSGRMEVAVDCWLLRYADKSHTNRKSSSCSKYCKIIIHQLNAVLEHHVKVTKAPDEQCSILLTMDTLAGYTSNQLLDEVQRYTDQHLSGDAVAVLRQARKVYLQEQGGSKTILHCNGVSGGSPSPSTKAIDLDPRAKHAVQDELLFKTLMDDMASPVWKYHGKSKSCEVWTDSRPGYHFRFRTESFMDLDLLSCLAVSNEVLFLVKTCVDFRVLVFYGLINFNKIYILCFLVVYPCLVL